MKMSNLHARCLDFYLVHQMSTTDLEYMNHIYIFAENQDSQIPDWLLTLMNKIIMFLGLGHFFKNFLAFRLKKSCSSFNRYDDWFLNLIFFPVYCFVLGNTHINQLFLAC